MNNHTKIRNGLLNINKQHKHHYLPHLKHICISNKIQWKEEIEKKSQKTTYKKIFLIKKLYKAFCKIYFAQTFINLTRVF